MKVHIIIKTDSETDELIKICGVYSSYIAAMKVRSKLAEENEKFCEKYGLEPDEFTVYTEEVEE